LKLSQILWVSALFIAGIANTMNDISPRFVPWPSVAALSGQWALWQNPAGLAFLQGTEYSLAYLYEWNALGNRQHGGANIALSLWDTWTLAAGLNARAAFAPAAEKNFGSDITGIFGTALNFNENSSVGISFMKTHNLKTESSDSTMVSFGFISRPSSYLSIGGLYQEVHDGFFKAPDLSLGIAGRPFGELLTLSLDGRFSATTPKWNSFRFDPIFGIKGKKGGVALSLNTEIPGLKDGWLKPKFLLGAEFNFAHIGFNLSSLINANQSIYGLGGSLRASSAEWESMRSPKGLWVNLTLGPNGTLEEKRASLAMQLFGKEDSPLAVLALLKRLKSDPIIEGVIICLRGFDFGDARAQEWHEALLALRNAQKQVIVYLHAPSERDYYVATAANKIYMNPYATLSFTRFQKTLVYVADLLKKLGVKAEEVTAGIYKTAPRTFTNSVASKEEIEVYNNILNSFYDELLLKVSSTRSLSKDKIKGIFDAGEISAPTAKEYGLIDELIFKDEIEEVISGGLGLQVYDGYENRVLKREKWASPKKIIVIPIAGDIVRGRVHPTLLQLFGLEIGSLDVVDEIESAVLDPDVVAIIVRIDSPGGDAGAGEDINRALIKAQEKKTIIASMSDIAASAGYMIAAGATHILAEKNTITGSIGVFSLNFSANELAKKIGVNTTELTPIKNPGPTIFRLMSESEREQAQKIVDWFYENFITIVASGLELDEAYVRKNADGRVWLGSEAFTKKLVNEIGGFAEAIDAARLFAEIPESEELDIEIRHAGYEPSLRLSGRLAKIFNSPAATLELARLKPLARPYIKALEAYRLSGIPQARLPFDFVKLGEQ